MSADDHAESNATFPIEHLIWSSTGRVAKHSKHFVLADAIDIGLGRMQRNFEPMRKQVEGWRDRGCPLVATKRRKKSASKLVQITEAETSN
jgi:hypothetical protein